jgi:hypothetical protein
MVKGTKVVGVDLTEGKDRTAITVVQDGQVVRQMFINEVVETEDGKKYAVVNADVLLPMLVYLRKFFKKIQQTNRNAPSRFVDPEDFELAIGLRGFTPEDFNSLQSLANSMGHEVGELLDAQVDKTPQMRRTNEFGSMRSRQQPPVFSKPMPAAALPPPPSPSTVIGSAVVNDDFVTVPQKFGKDFYEDDDND